MMYELKVAAVLSRRNEDSSTLMRDFQKLQKLSDHTQSKDWSVAAVQPCDRSQSHLKADA